MSAAVLYKLLAIFLTVGIGWFAGRMRWLGEREGSSDPARVLSNAAFYIFVPALLFRTTARIAFSTLPWLTLAAFFGPAVLMILLVYGWQRRRNQDGALPVAAPSVRAITAGFGNSVQLGVPMAAAVFGETGLALHISIMSLHSLILLTLLTLIVEFDIGRTRRDQDDNGRLLRTLKTTVRNTVIHPAVLPVLAGLSWNAAGLPIPAVIDEVLALLGTAVSPLCLVLIGMSLAYYGLGGSVRGVLLLGVLKLLVLPGLVLIAGHWVFGLNGLPLGVVVMLAAVPTGSNALLFAQRYHALEDETTSATVIATFAFVLTAPMWLAVLGWVG